MYAAAFARVPNQGGPFSNQRTPIAFRMATRPFVPNATRYCAGGMPTATSAITWAGNVAAIYIHHFLLGTSSSAQKRMVLGGQKGAKIRSESVPIAKAA